MRGIAEGLALCGHWCPRNENREKLKMGGDDMDNAIMMYMRTVRRCCIDRRMAELIKAKVGSAWELDSEPDFEVLGQDIDEGGMRTYTIDSREIREEALAGVFDRIEDSLSDFMTHRVSREYVADIAKHGFVLAGSCARLPFARLGQAACRGNGHTRPHLFRVGLCLRPLRSSLRACFIDGAAGGGTPALPVRRVEPEAPPPWGGGEGRWNDDPTISAGVVFVK